jgi:hypothetical protein
MRGKDRNTPLSSIFKEASLEKNKPFKRKKKHIAYEICDIMLFLVFVFVSFSLLFEIKINKH